MQCIRADILKYAKLSGDKELLMYVSKISTVSTSPNWDLKYMISPTFLFVTHSNSSLLKCVIR